jgi:hypothetical protein
VGSKGQRPRGGTRAAAVDLEGVDLDLRRCSDGLAFLTLRWGGGGAEGSRQISIHSLEALEVNGLESLGQSWLSWAGPASSGSTQDDDAAPPAEQPWAVVFVREGDTLAACGKDGEASAAPGSQPIPGQGRRQDDADMGGESRWRREEWWDGGVLRFVAAAGVSAVQPQVTLLERIPGHAHSLLPLFHTMAVGGRAVILQPIFPRSDAPDPQTASARRGAGLVPRGAASTADIIWGLQLVSPTSLVASSKLWRALRASFLQDLRVVEALGRGEGEVWDTFRRRYGLGRLRSAVVFGEAVS